MPIVTDNVGLRRYAVFSFVEDKDRSNPNSAALRFPSYPSTAIHEVAAKLAHSENFLLKRMRTLEKGVLNPFLDASFFASYQGMAEVAKAIDQRDCINFYDKEIHLEKAVFEEVQMVDPKKDMIETPIDEEEPSEKAPIQPTTRKISGLHITPREDRLHKGYIVMAFKTLEHMDNREFVSRWKTWTGVRFICARLPRQLGLKRIAFYRRLSDTSAYTYILLIEISNLLCYAAQTLNLLDRIKLQLCGYVGVYREIEFKIDPVSANFLNLEPNDDDSNDRPAISVTNPPELEEKLKTPAEKPQFLTVPAVQPNNNSNSTDKLETKADATTEKDGKPFSFKLIEQVETADDTNLLDYEKRFPALYKKRQNSQNRLNTDQNGYNHDPSPIQSRNPFEKSSLVANGNSISYGTYDTEKNPLTGSYQSFNNPFERDSMTKPSPFVYGGRIANANFSSNFKNPLEETPWVRDSKHSELRTLVPISDAEDIVKKAQQSTYDKSVYNQARLDESTKSTEPKSTEVIINMTEATFNEDTKKVSELAKDVGSGHKVLGPSFNSPNYDRAEYQQKQMKEPQLASSLISSINSVGASLLSSAKAKVASSWPATELFHKSEAAGDRRNSTDSVRSNKSVGKNPFITEDIQEQPAKPFVPYCYNELNRSVPTASYSSLAEEKQHSFNVGDGQETQRRNSIKAPLEQPESNMIASYHEETDKEDTRRSSFSRVLQQHPYTPYDPPVVPPSRQEQLDKIIAMLSSKTFTRDPMGRRSLGTREEELSEIQTVAMRNRHGSFDYQKRPQLLPKEDLIRQLKQTKQIQSDYFNSQSMTRSAYSDDRTLEDPYALPKLPEIRPDPSEYLQMSNSYPPSDITTANPFYPVEKSPIPARASRPLDPTQKVRKASETVRLQPTIKPRPSPKPTPLRSVKQTVSDPNKQKSSISPVVTVTGRKSSSPSPRNSRGPSPTRGTQRSSAQRSGPSPPGLPSRRKK